MIKETFTNDEKIEISRQIKNISFQDIEKEMNLLVQTGVNACNASPRSRIGNNVVDFFTFTQRLATKGKYNINFYDFIVNIDEFKKKKFIQNMLHYYDTVKNKTKKKNHYTVLKEVYNICISAINIIRPLVYMEIYTKYNPTSILDFCAGWGGAAVAASALNVPNYIGVEINYSLIQPYNKLCNFLKERSKTNIQMLFENALMIDYSKLDYDLVFTSPPYYFIQKYENNTEYASKKEMDDKFYIPLFSTTYTNLKPNGVYALNINKEVYENVCIKLFGPAHDIYPYKKSKRQNNYDEIVYVWKK
jgi:tRNA1(Val) A37 N6-methylase TrmN6